MMQLKREKKKGELSQCGAMSQASGDDGPHSQFFDNPHTYVYNLEIPASLYRLQTNILQSISALEFAVIVSENRVTRRAIDASQGGLDSWEEYVKLTENCSAPL
eukprot:COSAG02_NODE_3951_length_5993_cov_4.177978_3_plen_104_part_00